MLARENVLKNAVTTCHGSVETNGTYHKFTADVGGMYPRLMFLLTGIQTNVGDVYTISYWAKSNDDSSRVLVVVANPATQLLSLSTRTTYTTEWEKYVYTFTCKTDSFDDIRLALWTKEYGSGNGEILEVREVQINRGSEASEIWTPAMRDLTTEQQNLLKYGEYTEIQSF